MPMRTTTDEEPQQADDLTIRLPARDAGDQDEEWCEVVVGGRTRRVRFHDYEEIFAIPGLYERLFYDELECASPRVVKELLSETLDGDESLEAGDLRVLDVGAGNGIVAEELSAIGVGSVVGVDILEEAAEAAARDRPDLYDDYHVVDLTAVPRPVHEALTEADFNCLTSVAALGFGDIPTEAFIGAYEYLADGGLVVMSIKTEFVERGDGSGFARMISDGIAAGALDVRATRRFTHRLSAAGEPLSYDAIVAAKSGELTVPG